MENHLTIFAMNSSIRPFSNYSNLTNCKWMKILYLSIKVSLSTFTASMDVTTSSKLNNSQELSQVPKAQILRMEASDPHRLHLRLKGCKKWIQTPIDLS